MAKQKESDSKAKAKRSRPGKTSDVEFDKHKLDVEWERQPGLMLRYSCDLADARRDLDIAKSKLDVVSAEIANSIRADPESYGVEGKATEAGIKTIVPGQQEYMGAESRVRGRKHDVDILAAYVVALDHRRKALEKEVDLFMAGYFAEPRARREGHEAIEDQGDERTFGRRKKRSSSDCQLHKKRSRKTAS